ncbi:MAG: hypothetical protein GXP46_01940 [Deferribacteres bacterium]|nr:hypothetical protein [Deferribacteres bacterium]
MGLLLLNGAGTDSTDPILKGLGFDFIISPESMDVADVNDVGIDNATGFPITNSVLTSLHPAETVIEKGTAGSYDDTLKQLAIGSTTGLAAGDFIYLSHAAITDGIYEIASVVDATNVTLVSDPFSGGGNQTAISYQVAWAYAGVAGTAPSVLDGVSYYKSDLDDGLTSTQTEDTNYIASPPAGASYIAIDGKSYTGQTTNDPSPTLVILSGWTNKGGVTHVELSGTDAFWDAGLTDQAEKDIATAEAGGLYLSSGDGLKSFNIILKSASGGVQVSVACDITLDTSGPTITHSVVGR